MAIQTINIGSSPNKGDGDPLRIAFDKINDNFIELYAQNFGDPENQPTNIIPSQDGVYDLGSLNRQWADLYVKDFLYLGGVRIETTAQGNLALAGNVVQIEDTVGSVFGDDSTVLVDGVNSSINLDGTVKGNIIPDVDVAYDLGSATNRFRDLYLSGSTIDLGGTTISVVGGELQLGGVKVITQSELDVVVQNDITTNLKGSVFADDSTLLVDGVNGEIVGPIKTSDIQADRVRTNPDGSPNLIIMATNEVVLQPFGGDVVIGAMGTTTFRGTVDFTDATIDWASIVGGAIQNNGLPVLPTQTLDISGSVFADDSTLLVDGVNGKLIGDVVTTSITNSRDIDIASEDDVAIITSAGNNNYEWFFNSGGYLDFPNNADLNFNGDAGIRFFTPYDPEAGTTANVSIRDTGSTADLTIENEATNGDINITTATGGDVNLTAGDDINLDTASANGDIRLRSQGEVYIYAGYDAFQEPQWRFTDTGLFEVPNDTPMIKPEDRGNTDPDNFVIQGGDTLNNTGGNLVLDGGVGAVTNGNVVIGTNSNQTIINGNVDFGNAGTIDFSGATITGIDYGSIVATQIQTNGIPLDTNANNLIARDGQVFYIQSTSGAVTTTNVAFTYDTNVSGNVKNIFYGTTEFGNNGEAPAVNFTGATISGLGINSVDKFVNRSLFTSNATVTSGSANLLQFDAYQGQQAFDEVTYQWTPANTGLYRIDFVVGVTQGQVDIPFIAFLYNVTANSGQLQLFNGSFSGIVMSMSGTTYLTAGQSYQIGIIQTSGSDITLDSNLTSVGIEELTRV